MPLLKIFMTDQNRLGLVLTGLLYYLNYLQYICNYIYYLNKYNTTRGENSPLVALGWKETRLRRETPSRHVRVIANMMETTLVVTKARERTSRFRRSFMR
jgi:hypothetical protein